MKAAGKPYHTVPAVEMKNIRKSTKEAEKALKLVQERGGGG